MARLKEQIVTLNSIVQKTEKATEKTRLEVKLQRMETELRILEERAAIERRQAELTQALPASPLSALREKLRNLDVVADEAEARIKEINTERRQLVATRDQVQDRLDGQKDQAKGVNAANFDLQEQLFNVNEQLRALALSREAQEARMELAVEAERLRAAVKELDGFTQPNLKALIDLNTRIATSTKASLQTDSVVNGLENNLKVARENLDLGRQKVAKFDEELAVLEKQTGFFRKDEAVERLLAIQRGQKKSLVERLPLLAQQVEALESSAKALKARADLINLERSAYQELYDAFKARYISHLKWPGFALGGLLIVYLATHFALLPAFYRKENLLLARRLARYAGSVAAVGIVAGFLFEDLSMVAATLGVVSAALVIALQDVCTSVAGWFVIMLGGKFTIGDRLEVDGSRGDVVDIQLLRTTLIEVGEWMESDNPTGRVIVIPNNFIFKGKVYNFSHQHSFIWDNITLTLAFTTPVAEAMALFHRVLADETKEEFHAAQAEAAKFRSSYGVDDAVYMPRISTAITDTGVALRLIFVAHYRRMSATKNRIHRRLISELEHNRSIQLANTTYNILHAPLTTDAPAAIMGQEQDLTSRPPFPLGGLQGRSPLLPGR